jgi:hypothetical protein
MLYQPAYTHDQVGMYEGGALGWRGLQILMKGPMTVTGFIAYAQGWGSLYIRAHKLAYQMIHRHPGLGITNKYGIPDCPERVHWEAEPGKLPLEGTHYSVP